MKKATKLRYCLDIGVNILDVFIYMMLIDIVTTYSPNLWFMWWLLVAKGFQMVSNVINLIKQLKDEK